MLTKLTLQSQTLLELRSLLKPQNGKVEFLGYILDLESGIMSDKLRCKPLQEVASESHIKVLSALLTHYVRANQTPLTRRHVKFKDIPGGYAYEAAFIQRAIEPISKAFNANPEKLLGAAKLMGGQQLSFGDFSIEITTLKGIPLTYILWKTDEFPISANILYDESASNYLPTEDLAVLGEITTCRLIEAGNF